MNNHPKYAETAKRLIAKHGRAITFIRHGRTVDDTSKPWRGATDPRQPVDATSTQIGVFVPVEATVARAGFAQQRRLDNSLESGVRQYCLVGPGKDATVELEDYDEIVDASGLHWKITYSDVLEPGTQRIVFLFEVER